MNALGSGNAAAKVPESVPLVQATGALAWSFPEEGQMRSLRHTTQIQEI